MSELTTAVIKRYRPTSHGIRGKIRISRRHLYRGSPIKSLCRRLNSKAGRNSSGHITARFRKSRSHREIYRIVDFSYSSFDEAVVERLEYDPNRSSWIAAVKHDAGYSYVIAIEGMKVGDRISRGGDTVGCRQMLSDVKVGTEISCISSNGHGPKSVYCRAAGSKTYLLGIDGNSAIVSMPSGERRVFNIKNWATIGRVSNKYHSLERNSKAGDSFRKGFRPKVRGMAMTAYDHPMGSESGKNKGHHPKTFTGKLAKGVKTRKRRNPTNSQIIKRRDGSHARFRR